MTIADKSTASPQHGEPAMSPPTIRVQSWGCRPPKLAGLDPIALATLHCIVFKSAADVRWIPCATRAGNGISVLGDLRATLHGPRCALLGTSTQISSNVHASVERGERQRCISECMGPSSSCSVIVNQICQQRLQSRGLVNATVAQPAPVHQL